MNAVTSSPEYRQGQLAEQRHQTGDSVLDAVTRDALGHGVVYAPGAYVYDLAAAFPAASAGLGGPWPSEGLVEASGRTYLTEPATAVQVQARLLAVLAGPGLAGREVTVVRCTLTPASGIGGAV
ncbi:hypothetical protein [Streptomyces sp. NPDC023838]|uniref:hypothetical protein n=1 Tax=Streptomyces sp. NPDC023838 TaxID=3154325 RepID=UPI003402AED9